MITTNVSGNPEIICHQHNGLLIEPRNAKAIEDTLRVLISNPGLVERLSDNAFESCKHLGSWEEIQQNIEKFVKAIELHNLARVCIS